jgi:hypothetical protein
LSQFPVGTAAETCETRSLLDYLLTRSENRSFLIQYRINFPFEKASLDFIKFQMLSSVLNLEVDDA